MFKRGDWVIRDEDVSDESIKQACENYSTDGAGLKMLLSSVPFKITGVSGSELGVMTEGTNYMKVNLLRRYLHILEEGEEL